MKTRVITKTKDHKYSEWKAGECGYIDGYLSILNSKNAVTHSFKFIINSKSAIF